MVSLWYLYGIFMVFISKEERRKSVVKRDFQRGEKHEESRGKTIFSANIWRNQIFCLFLHTDISTNIY